MKRFILCLTLLAVPILEGNALAQARQLNTCWPAFSYDGKPVQKDGTFSETMVAGSQLDTSQYRAGSKTLTAADGKLQVRLDCRIYKNFPVEEYSVQLTNLSQDRTDGNHRQFPVAASFCRQSGIGRYGFLECLARIDLHGNGLCSGVVPYRSRQRASPDDNLWAVVE